PTISEERIATALSHRRRRFEHALVQVEPAVLDALDRLRSVGIRTALVSDAGWDDVEFWHRSPLTARFDTTVFSYEVGIRKPDRRIYEHALSGIETHPTDAVFVGDGGSDEHRGARAVGMSAVLVTKSVFKLGNEILQARRKHVDWEFEDVPTFVRA